MRLHPALSLVAFIGSAHALDNGLARVPFAGWNSWNSFGINAHGQPKLPGQTAGPITGDIWVATAKALQASGLAAAGYEYVGIDCGYSTGLRDKTTGLIQVNETRFPGGLKPWVAQVHALGLKAGIYLDAGPVQCCSRVVSNANDGSLGHEKTDAQWLVDQGFDLLKYDDCSSVDASYHAMQEALNKTGKPVVYSIHGPTGEEAVGLSNSWRTTGDISNDWDSIMKNLHLNQQFHALATAGSWPQADMMEAFQPNVTWNESLAHVVLWAAVKSPLLLGFDVRGVTSEQVEVLRNPRVLAISRDPLARSAVVVANSSSLAAGSGSGAGAYPEWEVWAAAMEGSAKGGFGAGFGGVAIPLHVGDGPDAASIEVDFATIPWLGQSACADVVDVMSGETRARAAKGQWVSAALAPHSADPVFLSEVACTF